MNPVQIARGIEKTATALVSELILMSREVSSTLNFPQIIGNFENHDQNYLAADLDFNYRFCCLPIFACSWNDFLNSAKLVAFIG